MPSQWKFSENNHSLKVSKWFLYISVILFYFSIDSGLQVLFSCQRLADSSRHKDKNYLYVLGFPKINFELVIPVLSYRTSFFSLNYYLNKQKTNNKNKIVNIFMTIKWQLYDHRKGAHINKSALYFPRCFVSTNSVQIKFYT